MFRFYFKNERIIFYLVPKITKQIVSKSISSMEEMSQRINESQNVSTNQIPEKVWRLCCFIILEFKIEFGPFTAR